jgi:hypothetical protein
MTDPGTPESPTTGELLRAIGRLEKTTDNLGGKIDHLDDKWDRHAEGITRHEAEIRALQKDFQEFRDDTRRAQQQRSGWRGNIAGALTGGASGAVFGFVVQLITHH